MSSNPAIDALKQMGRPGPAGSSTIRGQVGSDVEAIKHLKAFVEALRETYRDATFTSSDVFQWCEHYWVTLPKGTIRPQPLVNTYGLGRFLKNHAEEIGIVKVGSYGNRPVYQVLTEEDGKSQ